ncbi:MAG: hypothetical protein KHX31_02535 [Akkermansia sp.]|jgi:hypothetical protein|uniref:hypothetical protein n=1 Tax=Akkermansia sp. TaxID=1872421 RepID=UPI0015E0DA06|nr:hypothetical protein [Akkermansia sp.]MBS5507490.1 hypothetical protein [Akkermansia sp.]
MTELSKPIPMRLPKQEEAEMRELANKTAVPFSVIVRLSVQHGLPILQETLPQSKKGCE